MIYSLVYEGRELASWRCVEGWVPYYASILAVPYQGKLTLFRAVGMVGRYVELDLV